MRFWLRRRPDPDPPRWDDALALEFLLRAQVDDVLAVEQRQLWGRSIAFGGRLRLPPGSALDVLRARLEPSGYTPFLREDQGTTWVYALPRVDVTARSRPLLHLGLFLLTLLTTLLAGASMLPWEALTNPLGLVAGMPYAFSLLSILAVHELGHYTVGRRHGMPVSLPYFIPAPPPFFGTLGAVIRLRGPARDRRALFDMAVAGPLAGLLVALPVLVIGFHRSAVVPLSAVATGTIELGEPLLLQLVQWLVFGPIGDHHTVLLDPVAFAGWFGLLVTALNLIPAGQLDGGHLVYAMFGRRHLLVSKVTVGALIGMGLVFRSANWLIWAILIVALMGFQHAPPMDDVTPLDGKRRALGLFALALIVVLVPPVPFAIH